MRDLINRYGSLRRLGIAYTQQHLTIEEERVVEEYVSPQTLLAWQLAEMVQQLRRAVDLSAEGR